MRRAIPADILAQLPAAGTGLTGVAAAAVLARAGPNDIVNTTSRGWRDLVANTATDPMLWFLLCTSVLFVVVGDVGGLVGDLHALGAGRQARQVGLAGAEQLLQRPG